MLYVAFNKQSNRRNKIVTEVIVKCYNEVFGNKVEVTISKDSDGDDYIVNIKNSEGIIIPVLIRDLEEAFELLKQHQDNNN